jgi:glyoxylase-like metal-dependent hydrolase (beta-lactamase superfamily II)
MIALAISAQAQQPAADAPAAKCSRSSCRPVVAAAATEASGTVQFIGTATVLIRYQGFTILTDPNFLHKGDHVHLGYGLTAERLTNPAIELDKLPPIDLVVLSHMHEDHFDKLVQEKLAKDTPIVTTKEAAASLEKLGFNAAASASANGTSSRSRRASRACASRPCPAATARPACRCCCPA